MNRIDKTFKKLKKSGGKAFIAYTVAGYPSFEMTEKIVSVLEESGVDIIELGVPFSDPIMDGKSIQIAAQKALRKNVNLPQIIKFVKRLRKKTDIPIALMSYFNPIYTYPFDKFMKECGKAGVDGLIIPDLSFEESGLYRRFVEKSGLKLIQFISPTTSVKRINRILKAHQGFTYCISIAGVTGARKDLPADLTGFLRKIKRKSAGALAVGIGISRPEQASFLRKYADGIIVGSAFINIQLKGRKIIDNTKKLAVSLRRALDIKNML